MDEDEKRNLVDEIENIDVLSARIHREFGSPGDYGYETTEGKALFAIYKFQHELRKIQREFEP